MNELFVNVKVDREERPDVDAVYMDAVVSADRPGRLADDRVPDARRRAVLRRHVLPAGAAARPAVVPPAARARSREAYRERRDDVARAGRGSSSSRCSASAQTTPSSEPLDRRAASTRPSAVLRAQFDPQLGRLRAARRSSRPRRRSSSCCAAASCDDSRSARSTAWRAGGMYDLVGGGFHRYSVDAQWLVPHFEKMLYDNALLVPPTCTPGSLTGEDALPPRRRGDDRLRAARAAARRRRLRLGAGRRHRRRRGLTFTWTAEELAAAIGPGRDELLQPFEHGRSILRGALDRRTQRARSSRCASSARSRCATTRRSPPGTASRSPRSPRRARRLDRADWLDAARELAEFLLGPLSDGGRLHRTWRDGVAQGHGLPRGLRERRARPLRAARRDRRAALARGVAPARAARGRALRRRRARRLLPDAGRRRAARRAQEGPRRQPDAVRQLDARLRAAPARADLRRRRARAARGLRAAARARRDPAGADRVRLGALRARPPSLAAAGARDRRRARRRGGARGAARRSTPNAVVAFGPAEDVPLLAGKDLVDGKPAVYVCERFACRAPVTDPALL